MNDASLPSPANDAKAAPTAGSRGGIWDHPIAAFLTRQFSPLSAPSLLGVLIVFLVCVALWEIAWLRPYLAAGGAGLAAFLGPIPGIISPDSRSKWLASGCGLVSIRPL